MLTFKAVVFDLDGTIYHGNTLVEGACELVESLKVHGIRVFYCSNNSSQTRDEICSKLSRMGLSVSSSEIFTAAHATAHYLKQKNIRKVFCFGSIGLRHELQACGIDIISEPERAPAVVIGLDSTINYERISELLVLRGKQYRLIACNRDKFFPLEDGKIRPGCGFIVKMVEELLEKKVDHVVGKPNDYMLNLLMNDNDLTVGDIVLIGDSLESDIAMADAAGCRSILLSHCANVPVDVVRVTSLGELQNFFGTCI